jgi:RimJ/RimL family protein N-acetyltransferase
MPFPLPDTRLRLTLEDGTPVLVRPVTKDDRSRLAEGLARLSPRSRLSRFFSPFPYLSEEQLRYLTDVDQDHHVAWGAVTDDDAMVGLAVGRFARLPDEPSAAEVAVTVVDEYQHRGLGKIMLALLYLSAQRLGLERFHAHVLLENSSLVQALQALGGTLGDHAEGAIEISVPVLAEGQFPEDPALRPFRDLMRQVEAALDAVE